MEVVFTSRFFDDLERVQLASKQEEIIEIIGLLATIPEMGNRSVPASIREAFGDSVRKLVVRPFLAIYEILETDGVILALGLIHQRQAR